MDDTLTPVEQTAYTYNLQGRMATATVDLDNDGTVDRYLEYEFHNRLTHCEKYSDVTVTFWRDFGSPRAGESGAVTSDSRFDADTADVTKRVGGVWRVDYADGSAARVEDRNDIDATFDAYTLDYHLDGHLYHRATQSDDPLTYSYDGKPQLTSVDSTVNTADEAFTYNATGNKKEYTKLDKYDRLLKDRDHYYAYDDEGNLTEKWPLGTYATGSTVSVVPPAVATGTIQLEAGRKYEFAFDNIRLWDAKSLLDPYDHALSDFFEVTATVCIPGTQYSDGFEVPSGVVEDGYLVMPRTVLVGSETRANIQCTSAEAGM